MHKNVVRHQLAFEKKMLNLTVILARGSFLRVHARKESREWGDKQERYCLFI
jgi:hypothetical protein